VVNVTVSYRVARFLQKRYFYENKNIALLGLAIRIPPSSRKYSFMTIERKGIGPLVSSIVYVSPSTVSKIKGLSQ
jgi:hypothetical protein